MSTKPNMSVASMPQAENPLLNVLRLSGSLDPHHLVEAIQKLFPFGTIPGIDAARLVEMQEKNVAVLQAVTQHLQEVLSNTAKSEFQMVQKCVEDAIRMVGEISQAKDPFEASAKQTEMVVLTVEKLSRETVEVLTKNSEQLVTALKDLALRYIKCINELKPTKLVT